MPTSRHLGIEARVRRVASGSARWNSRFASVERPVPLAVGLVGGRVPPPYRRRTPPPIRLVAVIRRPTAQVDRNGWHFAERRLVRNL